MTRKEAIEKIPHPRWSDADGQRGWLLDSLQALGFIKFEQDLHTTEESPREIIGKLTLSVDAIIIKLNEAGFEIKKIRK